MWSWFVEAQWGTLLFLWHSWKLGRRNEHLISYYTWCTLCQDGQQCSYVIHGKSVVKFWKKKCITSIMPHKILICIIKNFKLCIWYRKTTKYEYLFFKAWFILCKTVTSPNNRDLSSDNSHRVHDFLCMILRSESGGQLVHAKSQDLCLLGNILQQHSSGH